LLRLWWRLDLNDEPVRHDPRTESRTDASESMHYYSSTDSSTNASTHASTDASTNASNDASTDASTNAYAGMYRYTK